MILLIVILNIFRNRCNALYKGFSEAESARGHGQRLFAVIASNAKQSTVFGCPALSIATLVTLARNDIRVLYLPLLTDSNLPATARNVYVRAVRHNIDAALWGATYTSVAHK